MRKPSSLVGQTIALLCLSFFALTAPSLAQTPTAVVTGTVLDATGGAIPEATVTAINEATGVRSQKKTGADGTFTIINLLPGNYELTVEKEGFKKAALPPSSSMSTRR